MWAYRFHLAASGYLNSDAVAPQVIRIPGPGPGKLGVPTLIEGHGVRIGARLLMDGVWIMWLQRSGSNAAARLEVRDAEGNLVQEQDGDLGTFSYTWGDVPVYLLVLDKDGTYTARMTLDYPGGRLTGETSFTIPGKEPVKTK
jgi:hypothetical protein